MVWMRATSEERDIGWFAREIWTTVQEGRKDQEDLPKCDDDRPGGGEEGGGTNETQECIYMELCTSLKTGMRRKKGERGERYRAAMVRSGQSPRWEVDRTGHDGVFLALVKDGGLLAAHRGEHCDRCTGRIDGRRERIERASAGGGLARDGARGSGRIRSRAGGFAVAVAGTGTGMGNLEVRSDRVSRHFGCQRIATSGRSSVNFQMSSQVGLSTRYRRRQERSDNRLKIVGS